jgi:Leucine-rich repeat (LRR) protein
MTQVLSLSHNQLTSAQSLCWFGSLKYVNLNFNSLTSIDGIQYCRELRHL